jgi:hypothetical protein
MDDAKLTRMWRMMQGERELFTDPELEIRQVFEAEDFGPALTPELREQEECLRERTSATR